MGGGGGGEGLIIILCVFVCVGRGGWRGVNNYSLCVCVCWEGGEGLIIILYPNLI